MSLVELFCSVDDFCQAFSKRNAKKQLGNKNKPGPKARLHKSEIITILIHFHQSHYRDFKAYYKDYVCSTLKDAFPQLVSYNRFVELTSSVVMELSSYLQSRFGSCSGVSFVDSTAIKVCHAKRTQRNKVFKGIAERGMSSKGWFFGFKLHLIVSDSGELVRAFITPGNVDDRSGLKHMTKDVYGKLFGDKGYISQSLFEDLFEQGIELITSLRKNMKNKLMNLEDKLLLRKRSLVETIIDQLKNISQIEHSRHRKPAHFMVNMLAGLIAYTFQPKKPSLNLPTQLPLPVLI